MTYTDLPDQGWVFWPVGNGDSTTVVVDRVHVIQVDLRDVKSAEDDDAVVAPIVDQLVEHLPRTADDRPRLAIFALGHHDRDHCAGALRLFDEVLVEQLWVTPRMWHEKASGVALCEDAAVVFAEAERRIRRTVAAAARGEAPAPGDQVRIVGDHPDADLYSFAALPQDHLYGPGTEVTIGDASSAHAKVTVHGPTAGDCSVLGETGRNSSSALLRVLLLDGDGGEAGLLLVGDADYSVLERMFAAAGGRLDQLQWDTALAAHHCSLHAVFGPNADGDEERKQLVLNGLEATARPGARIVVSSRPFQSRDASGDDPPHRVAREAYEEDVVTDEVLCTAEHPNVDDPRPVVFSLQPEGLVLMDPAEMADMAATASAESKNLSLSRAAGGPRLPLLAALGATSSVHPSARTTPHQATAGDQTGGGRKGLDAVHESVCRARGRSAGPPTSIGFG